MPADLTPEKALEKFADLAAFAEQWAAREGAQRNAEEVRLTATHVRYAETVRAILARVTPSETGYCGKGVCAALDGHEGTCAEASGWAHDPLTPTAVPGAGEVERVGVQYAKNVRGGGFNLNEDYVHDAEWHIEASADTGTSHTLPGRLYVVQCEWCPAAFAAHTKREAMELFRSHESEQRVIDETGDER